MWMASAVLSGISSVAPGLQTIRSSPHNKPYSQFLIEFLPWGGPRGPGQPLSHIFLTLTPRPEARTCRPYSHGGAGGSAPETPLQEGVLPLHEQQRGSGRVRETTGAGLGLPPGSAAGRCSLGIHSPACLLPFQSHSLSSSPLGSSVPSTVPERSSFSSQTGHGTRGFHPLWSGVGAEGYNRGSIGKGQVLEPETCAHSL